MRYICRCDDEIEATQIGGQVEVFMPSYNGTTFLCQPCTNELVKFLRNETAGRVLKLDTVVLGQDPEDYDDLSIPIDVESEDWQRDVRRTA